MRGIWSLAAAGLLLTTGAVAQDKTKFVDDGAAFATAPSIGADYGSYGEVTSMRGADVKITGEVAMTYLWSSLNPSPVGVGKYYGSEWQATTLDLGLEVKACDNLTFNLEFDLTDPWNAQEVYGQDELIKEAYLTLDSIGGTGFGLKAGKMTMPFGMIKDELVLSPYLEGYGNTYLNTVRNGLDSVGYDYEDVHSWGYDRRFGLLPFYNVNDCLTLEAAVFQDSGESNWSGRRNGEGGYPSRYTNDPGLSFAARAIWNPMETLAIYASGVTRYNKAYANAYLNYDKRSYATSIGFDYDMDLGGTMINLFGEWQHAWRPEFMDDSYSDDIHAGISYDLNECITLFAQYEWLKTHYGADPAPHFANSMQRAYLAGQYKLSSGAWVESGFQREWGDGVQANVLYASLGFAF